MFRHLNFFYTFHSTMILGDPKGQEDEDEIKQVANYHKVANCHKAGEYFAMHYL